MNSTYQIQKNLKEYRNIFYLMIEVKVVLLENKLTYSAFPIRLSVVDGEQSVNGFITIISGNQKELFSYFMVDAFLNFSSNSEIRFGYGDELINVIENVDAQNINPLPAFLEGIPHEIADNNWLKNLSENLNK
ncbi:hypothetical protein LJC68_05760 [Bacteroidales bacterium OttesenSCG-928-B11]|nr:hypothetical protein [Bacteroidales bacterium OttesenSCG-928-E04]MDL2312363.1 hypothetical protein [Bacteroidales bacterium OttesenSCG-928-B11]MDL2326592.1 hypothetical protein [Bacteroidales bacterium OttesenSCG-928-A14]